MCAPQNHHGGDLELPFNSTQDSSVVPLQTLVIQYIRHNFYIPEGSKVHGWWDLGGSRLGLPSKSTPEIAV